MVIGSDVSLDAWLSAYTRWLVSIPSALYVWWFRDVRFALFLCAAVANALVCKVLKALLRQPRPASSPHHGDNGMPSSHAASLFFFSAGGGFAPGGSWRCAMLHVIAAALALHRVRSGHHYLAQVAVGAALGAASGLLWRASEERCLRAALALSGDMGQHETLASALLLFLLFALGAATVASVERSKKAARHRKS